MSSKKERSKAFHCAVCVPTLSLRFLSRCLRTDTAFLIRWYKSSGISGASPVEPQ